MASDIQYPYAYDEAGDLIYIEDVDKVTRYEHTYTCPNCGYPMLPRLGEINAHCFAHSQNHKCGLESYIHKTAKYILADRFNNPVIPFKINLELKRPCSDYEKCKENKSWFCDHWSYKKEFDLTQYYKATALVEKDVKESDGVTFFRPDVLLKSTNPGREDIFIEVYHRSKSKKAKINSGHKIIEIRIRNLSDLHYLESQEVFYEGEDVTFYNFNAPSASPDQLLEAARKEAKQNTSWTIGEDGYPTCKQSVTNRRRNSNLQRYVVMKNGREFNYGIFESELNQHYENAFLDITFDINSKQPYPPISYIVAMLVPGRRTCKFCNSCCATEMVTWCKALKNGTTRKGTFDDKKGLHCPDFVWSDWAMFQWKEFQRALDEVNGYYLWINPTNNSAE